jgi:hypothetical protein
MRRFIITFAAAAWEACVTPTLGITPMKSTKPGLANGRADYYLSKTMRI